MEKERKYVNFNDYILQLRRRLLNDSHRKCEEKISDV